MRYLVLLIIFSLSSCVTYNRCKEKFGSGSDTVYVDVPVEIIVPADSAQLSVSLPELNKLPEDSVIEKKSTSGKLKAKVSRKKDVIRFDCNTDPIIIRDTVPCNCPPVTKFAPKPPKEKGGGWFSGIKKWYYIIITFIVTSAFWIILFKIFK